MVFGFGKPNIEKLEKKKDIKGLIKAMKYKDGSQYNRNTRKENVIREGAVNALIRIGEPSIKPLIKSLKTEKKRNHAVDALIGIGEPAVEALILALETKRIKSVKKIPTTDDGLVDVGSIRKQKYAIKPKKEYELKDKNLYRRSNAAIALGEIGDLRALEPLIIALGDEEEYMRLAAAEALSNIGDPRAVDPMINILKDTSDFGKTSVIGYIRKIDDEKASYAFNKYVA